MKKYVNCAVLALCLLLSACGGEKTAEAETAYAPADLMEAVRVSQNGQLPVLNTLMPEDESFGNYLTAYYQLCPEAVEDGVIRYAGGTDACELAVLRFTEETDMDEIQTALESYQQVRAGDFTGYFPEQAELVEAGLTVIQGCWAALLLCPEPETARDALLKYLGPDAPSEMVLPFIPETAPAESPEDVAVEEEAAETPATLEPGQPQTPEEVPANGREEPAKIHPESSAPLAEAVETPPSNSGAYDHDAVLEAWRSGDAGGLSEKNQAVLEAAKAVIEQMITEEMEDYEKELAIHDWMLDWGCYDRGTLSHLPEENSSTDCENPYGFLINRTGICLGYASTFQLFMDLLGIECMTVEGTAHGGTAEHAWNLVQLDGEWYGVDVTWDDPSTKVPVSEETAHLYFNVTSAFLRANDHQWEEDSIPEAQGTVWVWD